MPWYALFVKTSKETLVQKRIELLFDKSDCHVLIPKRKLTEKRQGKTREVVHNLFPGYVFIHISMSPEVYYKLNDIPNCLNILRTDGEYCTQIKDQEIDLILALTRFGELITASQIHIKENEQIVVTSGVLMGLDGIIKKIDKRKHRAKVSLTLMNRTVFIDLPIEILETAEKKVS